MNAPKIKLTCGTQLSEPPSCLSSSRYAAVLPLPRGGRLSPAPPRPAAAPHPPRPPAAPAGRPPPRRPADLRRARLAPAPAGRPTSAAPASPPCRVGHLAGAALLGPSLSAPQAGRPSARGADPAMAGEDPPAEGAFLRRRQDGMPTAAAAQERAEPRRKRKQ
ncbi:unnamed protein product [Urochloa humidicola]